ncbi:MAG: hypothetical protein B6229_09415 [Spirochaetaceae bacterium 4572_7]|nr:MAG: hypothetical protein B6229_09415 [Spirochaetaceae bacterium 4572_7]
MKKILIIDEATAFREFAKELCTHNNLDPYMAINGLDGNNKIRSVQPDLIILEKDLSRMDSMTLLKNKKSNPNTTDIPVIFVSKDVPNKKFLMGVIPLGVKKFLKKPMSTDVLSLAISEILKLNTEVDNTPCVLEVRLNENILFVEVAMGLNSNRLDVVKYKIAELIKLNGVKNPLVLIMLTDIPFGIADRQKLTTLIHFAMEGANIDDTKIRILTPSEVIRKYLKDHLDLYDVVVENSLDKVMYGFVNKSKDDLLFSETESHIDESINANYRTGEQIVDSKRANAIKEENKTIKVAVIDDDKVVHAIIKSVFKPFDWDICYYLSGDEFLNEANKDSFDLILLDLVMPGVDGFEVISNLDKKMYLKTIVLTSSTQRNDVMKVISFGVKNYTVKPINGESLKAKAFEIIKSHKA